MHVNVYAEDLESGIETYECGTTKSKEDKTYHFIKVVFKTGNAISFFASTEKPIETLVGKLVAANVNLKLLLAARKGLLPSVSKVH